MTARTKNLEVFRLWGVGKNPFASIKSVGLILCIILLVCCGNGYSGELHIIAEGDTVFVGSDFEYYYPNSGELGLTETGRKRWVARSHSQFHEGREIPKLSRLTGREFAMEIDGEVVSAGHFSSVVSSTLHPGLVIWDTLIRPDDDSVHLGFALHGSTLEMTDPRESEVFLEYFKSRGKLVAGGSER